MITDETLDQLNGLVVKYGLYSINLSGSKLIAIYKPYDESIYILYYDLVNPDWQKIENTLVEYTLLNGF